VIRIKHKAQYTIARQDGLIYAGTLAIIQRSGH